MMATIGPSCTTALKAVPGSSQCKSAGTMRMWPVLDTGKNSVAPCSRPRTKACRYEICGTNDGVNVNCLLECRGLRNASARQFSLVQGSPLRSAYARRDPCVGDAEARPANV